MTDKTKGNGGSTVEDRCARCGHDGHTTWCTYCEDGSRFEKPHGKYRKQAISAALHDAGIPEE